MNSTEITIDQALDVIKDLVSEYTLNSIKGQLYQKKHEKQKEAFDKKYNSWSYWSSRDGQSIIVFNRTFEDRNEALAWIKKEELGSATFEKMAFADSKGEARTLCSLKCNGYFEDVPFEIVANYYRDGLPTKKCKVVPSISYSVVCDVSK